MLGSHVDTLKLLLQKADSWRGAAGQVEIMQINATFPDGRAVVLVWNPEAVDNGDGTFTGDWVINPS